MFSKLKEVVAKYENKIKYIADGGIKKGEVYKRTIIKFKKDLEIGFDESSYYSSYEILYILNELFLDNQLFTILVEYEEVESFFSLVIKYKKISIYKKMFYIYFRYYSILKTENSLIFLTIYLKNILRNYDGKNRYIKQLVLVKSYIFGDLKGLLDYFDGDFDIVKQKLNLQNHFEFLQVLLNFKIIQDLEQLNYDEINHQLFNTIYNKKDIYFQDNFTLKEYVVKTFLDRAIKEQKPFINWQEFIIKLIGDPRSLTKFSHNMGSWDIIGQKRKEFFIKTLSKDDLKLFLEALSDSVSDTNYHYRKAFWMQFLDKVVQTKLMVGSDAYENLNSEMKKKFNTNSSYSLLRGNHSQSAIYIDFGVIKVIEFTHNGKVRFYKQCPINLYQKEYSRENFLQYNNLIDEIVHNGASTYNWQKKVLNLLKKYIHIDVTLQDTYIDEDKNKIIKYAQSIQKHKIYKSNHNTQKCIKCNKTKSVSEFYRSKKDNQNYSKWCKNCLKKYRNR